MPNWLERLRQEIATIAPTPFLFAAAVLVATVVIWGILHWSYWAALANKDLHIAFLERRVTAYRENLGGVTPEEAKRRIESLETELKTLRLRLQPRRLTPAQQQAILDRSRLPAGAPPNRVTIAHEENCSDCRTFASAFEATLRDSGSWIVGMEVLAELPERPRTGLGIRVPEPLRPPPEAVVLQQALRSAGLAYIMISGGADPNIELLITERIPQ
jgi:hypothetical protein